MNIQLKITAMLIADEKKFNPIVLQFEWKDIYLITQAIIENLMFTFPPIYRNPISKFIYIVKNSL